MTQRNYTCTACDGSGLDGDSGDGFWNQCDCPTCGGSGEFYACLTCGLNKAECDDYCTSCQVEFMVTNPAEFDPSESCWSLPKWRDAFTQITAALAAKAAA